MRLPGEQLGDMMALPETMPNRHVDCAYCNR